MGDLQYLGIRLTPTSFLSLALLCSVGLLVSTCVFV